MIKPIENIFRRLRSAQRGDLQPLDGMFVGFTLMKSICVHQPAAFMRSVSSTLFLFHGYFAASKLQGQKASSGVKLVVKSSSFNYRKRAANLDYTVGLGV